MLLSQLRSRVRAFSSRRRRMPSQARRHVRPALQWLEDRTAFATQFVLSGFSLGAIAGEAGTVTVRAANADGLTDTAYLGTIQFASSDGRAILPVDSALANGVGTFSVLFAAAGTQSLTVSD